MFNCNINFDLEFNVNEIKNQVERKTEWMEWDMRAMEMEGEVSKILRKKQWKQRQIDEENANICNFSCD